MVTGTWTEQVAGETWGTGGRPPQEYQLVQSWGLTEAHLVKCNVNALKVRRREREMVESSPPFPEFFPARGGEAGAAEEAVCCVRDRDQLGSGCLGAVQLLEVMFLYMCQTVRHF